MNLEGIFLCALAHVNAGHLRGKPQGYAEYEADINMLKNSYSSDF